MVDIVCDRQDYICTCEKALAITLSQIDLALDQEKQIEEYEKNVSKINSQIATRTGEIQREQDALNKIIIDSKHNPFIKTSGCEKFYLPGFYEGAFELIEKSGGALGNIKCGLSLYAKTKALEEFSEGAKGSVLSGKLISQPSIEVPPQLVFPPIKLNPIQCCGIDLSNWRIGDGTTINIRNNIIRCRQDIAHRKVLVPAQHVDNVKPIDPDELPPNAADEHFETGIPINPANRRDYSKYVALAVVIVTAIAIVVTVIITIKRSKSQS